MSEFTGTFTEIAPGIMLFAVLLLISYTATSLGREVEQGTLHRYRLARVPWPAMLGGVMVAQLVLASIAFGLMLIAAQVMGFEAVGSYTTAYAAILLTAVAAVGFGMIVAALVKGREEAANLSLLAALPLGFLSGAFFTIPGATIGGFDIYDALPTTHAMQILREVLVDGATAGDMTTAFQALGLTTLLTLCIGGSLFWMRRLRRAVPGPA